MVGHWGVAAVSTGASTEEPITLSDAKAHCRIDTTDEDSLVTALITAARRLIESRTQRSLLNTQWDFYADAFPGSTGALKLPRTPLSAVSFVRGHTSTGGTTDLSTAGYYVDTASEPGRVVLLDGYSWPSSLRNGNGCQVRFTAGYSTAGENVPEPLRQATRLLVAHLYENREAVQVLAPGSDLKELPFAVEALLMDYVLPEAG